jgi:hypothetical protein
VKAVIYFLAGAEAAGLAAAAEAAGLAAEAAAFGASAAKAVTAKAAVITAAKSLFISGTFLKFE